jgi:hypothetical protein
MDVSGHFHAPAVFSRGKGPRYLLYRMLDGPQSSSRCSGEVKKNYISVPAGKWTAVVQPVAQSLCWLSYSSSGNKFFYDVGIIYPISHPQIGVINFVVCRWYPNTTWNDQRELYLIHFKLVGLNLKFHTSPHNWHIMFAANCILSL